MSHGNFSWYELMTSDPTAAEAFYTGVVGWSAQDAGMSDRSYTILSAGETPVGGMMAIPDRAKSMGARPGWIGYIAADDVDADVERVKQAGGAVHHGPEDIPGVGRFAVVGDPQGAAFTLFKGMQPPPPSPEDHFRPGFAGWHELQAVDREAAFAFYAKMFGWAKDRAHEMGGPVGVYQTFATTAGGPAIGGMMTKMAQVPVPFWLYYFIVDDIDAAAERVKRHGGQVINGPHEVPGGAWIVQSIDPQGAMFALVGPRKTAGNGTH